MLLLTSGQWGCLLDSGPKLAMRQPRSRQKKGKLDFFLKKQPKQWCEEWILRTIGDNWWQFRYFRGSHRRCSVKKVVHKNFAIFTEKHLCWSLFLINLQAFRPEHYKMLKNNYFEEHLLTAASDALPPDVLIL